LFCVIGLGNPGSRYEYTRHNVGFRALDFFAADNNSNFKEEKNNLVSTLQISNNKVLAIKPQLYMNKSGEAIWPILKFYKIEAEQVIVVHDELDLAQGVVKAKQGGGAGGHNGVSDIIRVIGKNFYRLRIGISHPRDINPKIDVSDWVLQRPEAKDLDLLEISCKRAAEFCEEIVKKGLKPAQEKFHALN